MKKALKEKRRNFFDVVGQIDEGDYGSFEEIIYSNKKRIIFDEVGNQLIKNYLWRKAVGHYLYVKKRKLHVFFFTGFQKVKHKKVEVPDGNIYPHEQYLSITKGKKTIAVYTPELKLIMRDDNGIKISKKDENGFQYCQSSTGKKKPIFFLP